MYDRENYQMYFGGYGIPEAMPDARRQEPDAAEPPVEAAAPRQQECQQYQQYQPYQQYQQYQPRAEQPRDVTAGRRRTRRPVLRAVAAIVCCLALMLGSGLAGAQIMARYLGVAPSGASTGVAILNSANPGSPASDPGYIPKNDAIADKGGDDGSGVNPLGKVNPDGQTLTLTDLFAGANPAVVAINTRTTGRNAFGRTVTLPAAGSGFIISDDGYIVTNNHVIDGAESISVLLHDGSKHAATLVGRDPTSDIAVLKIDAKDLSYLTWGDSDALLVGEQVAAIGNPLGEFANSMTVGYISALDREINIDGNPRHMLQTDAAVNSGNSGGPLINLKGRVIGIVSAKSSGMNVEGLGFAIPSSVAKGIVELLIKDGYVKGRPVMGVMIGQRADGDDEDEASVYVDSVNSGGAAEKAGIKVDDVILSANGKTVKTVAGLKEIINAMAPGDELTLKILRGGDEKTITVILDEYKPPEPARPDQNSRRPAPDGDYEYDPWSMFPEIEDWFQQR